MVNKNTTENLPKNKSENSIANKEESQIEIKIYDFLPKEAASIRQNVFVEEQGFKSEFDDIDDSAFHIVLFYNGKAVGTGRYFTEDFKDYHIGRIAVLKPYRKYGLGKMIINEIEKDLVNKKAERAVLSAQVRASGFYIKCGYVKTGGEYYDEYCPHITMVKNL